MVSVKSGEQLASEPMEFYKMINNVFYFRNESFKYELSLEGENFIKALDVLELGEKYSFDPK